MFWVGLVVGVVLTLVGILIYALWQTRAIWDEEDP